MRPSSNEYFSSMAQLVATRSTCLRRAVGCVLVNTRGHVLATGYNGVASGRPHCNQSENDQGELVKYLHSCEGAHAASGVNLDGCEAIHAEQNALLQCRDVHNIVACYVTVSPCLTCTKLLMNTSCRAIYFGEEYTHNEAARRLWLLNSERIWLRASQEGFIGVDASESGGDTSGFE